MGFLSKVITDKQPETDDDVAQVRGRARRRLIGAAVLLAIGVIGFPLLFETQPRPVAVDAPVVVGKDKPAIAPAAAKVADRSASASAPASTSTPAGASAPTVITERAQDAGRELPPAAAPVIIPVPAAVPPPAPDAARLARERADKERADKERVARERADKDRAEKERVAKEKADKARADKAERERVAREDEARRAKAEEERRARAALEGRNAAATRPAAAESGRFAVQVGAYASDSGVREVRTRLERVGLKSYTQQLKGNSGTTTRVRAGPYASRAEAEKAAEKARSVGLAPSIVPLGP